MQQVLKIRQFSREESEATSTRAAKNLSEKQKIIQEQGNLIKEKEKESSTDGPSTKDKEILAAEEKLKKKERAHDAIDKRLEIADALSTRTVNDMSEKEKMIQEQVKLIEKEKKEGSSDVLCAKVRSIMSAVEKLEEEVFAHAEIAKSLEEYGVQPTIAMKNLSEKQKLIQEQSRVIVEKEKESKENMAAVKKA